MTQLLSSIGLCCSLYALFIYLFQESFISCGVLLWFCSVRSLNFLCVLISPLLLQKKVVEQLRKELLVKQEPEAKLQLHVQTPPVSGDIKPGNLLQSQQIPGGLQQVRSTNTHTHIHSAVNFLRKYFEMLLKMNSNKVLFQVTVNQRCHRVQKSN